nr:L-asparaginase/ Glu-tRNAGln amidotransferase subunit D [Streptococcus thermophilus]
MSTISVIATGGTIACVPDDTGALVPQLTAADLIEQAAPAAQCRPIDIQSVDSSSMTLADVDNLVAEVHAQLDSASVAGVVVTHGTDSLADTAIVLDLFHRSPKPLVMTGAMGTEDGPGNLRRAIELAQDPSNGAGGVLVCVGDVLPARGLFKRDTAEMSPFSANPSSRPEPVAAVTLAGVHIPIIRAWPGAGGELIDFAVRSGANGIVVEALGAGNVSDSMGTAIEAAVQEVPVVVTTSVPCGTVEFAYGGPGGGSTLGALGAIPSGPLRAGQARMALAVALRAGLDPAAMFS